MGDTSLLRDSTPSAVSSTTNSQRSTEAVTLAPRIDQRRACQTPAGTADADINPWIMTANTDKPDEQRHRDLAAALAKLESKSTYVTAYKSNHIRRHYDALERARTELHWTYKALAIWLTEQGFPTKLSTLKYNMRQIAAERSRASSVKSGDSTDNLANLHEQSNSAPVTTSRSKRTSTGAKARGQGATTPSSSGTP